VDELQFTFAFELWIGLRLPIVLYMDGYGEAISVFV